MIIIMSTRLLSPSVISVLSLTVGGIIHKSVNRFCGWYTQVQNRRESGLTEQDKISYLILLIDWKCISFVHGSQHIFFVRIERAKELYLEKDPWM